MSENKIGRNTFVHQRFCPISNFIIIKFLIIPHIYVRLFVCISFASVIYDIKEKLIAIVHFQFQFIERILDSFTPRVTVYVRLTVKVQIKRRGNKRSVWLHHIFTGVITV